MLRTIVIQVSPNVHLKDRKKHVHKKVLNPLSKRKFYRKSSTITILIYTLTTLVLFLPRFFFNTLHWIESRSVQNPKLCSSLYRFIKVSLQCSPKSVCGGGISSANYFAMSQFYLHIYIYEYYRTIYTVCKN